LAQGLQGERTHRELRLTLAGVGSGVAGTIPEYHLSVPGEVIAPVFGIRLCIQTGSQPEAGQVATLRNWRPGDRVRVRHSSGPRKVKEVLERLRVTGRNRVVWPVLEIQGQIVWMRGVDLEPDMGIEVAVTDLPG
jgi:tRNA(Ile)-lysidine synthase